MMKTGLKSSSVRHYGMGARMVGGGAMELGTWGGRCYIIRSTNVATNSHCSCTQV